MNKQPEAYLLWIVCIAVLITGFRSAEAAQTRTGEEARPWRFVSIPDFLNNDVAYPEPKWDDALDYVLGAIEAEDPAFVLVAGDLVMGRWSEGRQHLWRMADLYYGDWMRRMEAHGLRPLAVVGDHEVGDDPWPPEKAALIPDYRRAFEEYLNMPDNGPAGFLRRAYSVRHQNLLLVVLDVFETDEAGRMQVGVSGEQLAWFRRTLEEHEGEVEHVVVAGHVPILPGWRARSSSRLSLPGGAASDLWQAAAEHGVDLYLCGEVHDISMQQRDGILQVVHGSQPSNVPEFNYLVVTVFPDRLELELKRIETTLEGPRDSALDPYGVDPYRERVVRLTPEQKADGFASVGALVLDKSAEDKRYRNRTGLFAERYDVLDPAGTADTLYREHFLRAARHGRLASEGFARSHRFMTDWLTQADPVTGLIPRNLNDSRDIWNAQDAAADNYPFMVLTAALTDRPLFHGRMREMLRTERRLTSRIGSLPDTYSFSKQGFAAEEPVLEDIIFGASEYIKDGLLPLTEWLGRSPWSERMLEMLDDLWAHAPVETPYGRIVSNSHEINGEMLQVLSRLYWMTGEEEYLAYALRLGDYYLLGENHPTRDAERLRLRDHGGEIVAGLTELYATTHFARPEKKEAYRRPLHAMLDRILEVGRGAHGLFYNVVDPQTGAVLDDRRADTFGYILNGYYTVYLVDGTEAYRRAVQEALQSLERHYRTYDWERGSADGDADAAEGALNLYNREPLPSTADWIDRQVQLMWSKQDSSHRANTEAWQGRGIIEGWHGDGNFARTSLMYSLWKTQGLHITPWREDVQVGAVRDGERLLISLRAEQPWTGTLHFDEPRHRTSLHLPLDWPRINQFPEWFTADPEQPYLVRDLAEGTRTPFSGAALSEGLALELKAGEERRIVVEPLENE